MKHIKPLIFLVCLSLANAEIDNTGLKAMMDELSDRIAQLEKQNSQQQRMNLELVAKNSELETLLSKMSSKLDSGTSLAFDCHLTGDYATNGPIKFSGCAGNQLCLTPFPLLFVKTSFLPAVDTTTQDPWMGKFVVPETGLWRFTFAATSQFDDTNTGHTYVSLNIDGTAAATTGVDPNPIGDTYGLFTMSLNSMHMLEAGQTISIELSVNGYGRLNDYNGDHFTHWTGEFLGTGIPSLPECEYPGQTFQYPGSCRKYWLCQSDGTVDLLDCCPDVYVPDAETCLSEEFVVVDAICNSEDICT